MKIIQTMIFMYTDNELLLFAFFHLYFSVRLKIKSHEFGMFWH